MWTECDAETLFWLARVAEKIKRGDHFTSLMTQFISIHPKLNDKERQVFASGHRSHLSSLRDSLGVLEAHARDAADGGQGLLTRAVEAKITECRKELEESCLSIVRQIESVLLPEVSDASGSAFYKRMIGDCYRYIGEHAVEGEAVVWAERAEAAYRAGLALALREVPHSHPLYLGLAVNFALCQSELCGNRQGAVKFSETVFKEAVKTIDRLSPDVHDEAVEIMQVLRENIDDWTNAQ
jgi:hypothetical protein